MPLHNSHIQLLSAARKARNYLVDDDEYDHGEIILELNLALSKYDSKLHWQHGKLPHGRLLFVINSERGIFTCKFCHTVYDRNTGERVKWNPPTGNGCEVCIEALKSVGVTF